MTGSSPAAATVRAIRIALGALLMACLLLPLAPQAASACDISYGYKPSLSLNAPNLGRGRPCSNATSLTGAAIIATLAISALAASGAIAIKRGEAAAGSLAPLGSPAQVLFDYLRATSTGAQAPEITEKEEGGGDDANTTT